MNSPVHSPSPLGAALGVELSEAEAGQMCDLAVRLMRMAALGTPRVESADPALPALLILQALSVAFLAVAEVSPQASQPAAAMAQAVAQRASQFAERCAATDH